MHFHGPNVVICKLFFRYQQMPLIGAYLYLSTLDHIPDLEDALNCLSGRYHVVLGGLNVDIGRLRNPRDQQVADFLSYFDLVGLLKHFRQQLCCLNL